MSSGREKNVSLAFVMRGGMEEYMQRLVGGKIQIVSSVLFFYSSTIKTVRPCDVKIDYKKFRGKIDRETSF